MWDPQRQWLFWTDALGKAIYVYHHDTGKVAKFTDKLQASSLIIHAEGGLVIGGSEGFVHYRSDDDVRPLASDGDGRPVNHINDIIADPRGRVFGGQEAFSENEPYDPGFLFRIDLDGSVQIVEENLHISNGMGFSLDQTTFYLVDSIPREIYAYDYDVGTGQIKNRRVLVKLRQDDGLPDGMTVDSEGFLWVARWFGGGVSRFDPDGKRERTIELPVAQTSSVMFGGPDLNEIYVTSAAIEWQSPIAPAGHDFTAPRGGPLFRIKQEIRGRPENLARI